MGSGDEADEREGLGTKGAQGLAVAGDTVEAIIVAHLAPVVQLAVFQHTLYQLRRVFVGVEVALVDIPEEIGRQLFGQRLLGVHYFCFIEGGILVKGCLPFSRRQDACVPISAAWWRGAR